MALEWVSMKSVQLPVLINNATTGHKLQGSGVEELFVHHWSYVTNWAYVMLSRVKSRKGLYCRSKLSSDLQRYAVPEALRDMIHSFEQKRLMTWNENE